MTREQLKAERERLGMSRAEIARGLGVDRATVMRWEDGVTPFVSPVIIEAWTEFLIQSRKSQEGE